MSSGKIIALWVTLFILSVSSIKSVIIAQPLTLRINEFLALNQSILTDEDGDYSDWIEIHNPTSQPINLLGWALTDDKSLPGQWIFPDVTIEINSYLIVFASGKNRKQSGDQLHTNFKISGNGEYLALNDPSGAAVSVFDPYFPVQQTDISFGLFENSYISFLVPTPGAVNLQTGGTLLSAPVFSRAHGFYDTPFNLEISCSDNEAKIYYTTNGSNPDATRGVLYSGPISIATTSIIRAIAIKDNQLPGKIATQTYLFLENVIHQANNPAGYPSEWGPYKDLPGNAIADYEMDPEMMADPVFANLVKDALLDLPTMSLITDKGLLFSNSQDPDTGGIYIYTGPSETSLGIGWERPVSLEYFDDKDSVSFQVDCGVQIQGGAGRLPEKSPKHSFRLVFKSIYGPSRFNYPLFGPDGLSSYNTIILRARFNNSWLHWRHHDRVIAQYMRDRWAKDTYGAMGNNFSHGIYVHLYINGMYWGIYNPSERMDNDFAEAYLGGEKDDYDIIKDYAEVVDGNITAWNNLMAQANAGLTDNSAYQRIQGNNSDGTPNPNIPAMVDVVSLADYMLLNFYGANSDWDHHNWVAIRDRVNPGTGFKFFCWDEEYILDKVNDNVLAENNDNRPSRVFQQLLKNEDYKRLFADRIQKYCFNSGALTPLPSIERWINRANQIEKAVDAESARWGDYRRDVHPWQTAGPFELYTKQSHWLPQMDFMLNTYFPSRTDVFISQLRNANLFPDIDAPVLHINNLPVLQSTILAGDVMTLTSNEGVIYYTTDGSDPVVWQQSSGSSEKVLIAENSGKWAFVPKSDIGIKWYTDLLYSTSGWRYCNGSPGGIGYEKNTGYQNMITLDVGNDMHSTGVNPNTSCYVRFPFNVNSSDLSQIKSLILNVRYDDGFVAYLNGTVVATANAPATLTWNSAATGSHEAGTSGTTFNISEYTSKLKSGENILAIHALNANTTSSDFIINAELIAGNKLLATFSPSAKLYSVPITINESAHIKARTSSNGEWSATTDQFLLIPSDFNDLRITEIHYHPLGQLSVTDNEFEFIEIKNTGISTLDIGGLQFIDGIEYQFPPETQLGSKQFIVLSANRYSFYERYGFMPFDEYNGLLDNGGEKIVLISEAKDTLCSIVYSDVNGWPDTPDGVGYSLVPTEFDPASDQNNPELWRASYHIGGSPGADDLLIPVGEEDISETEICTLKQNYPNPFTNVTNISYELFEDAEVELSVYNLFGQRVITLVNKRELSGSYEVYWNGLNQNNHSISNGIYLYRIVVRNNNRSKSITRKLILMK